MRDDDVRQAVAGADGRGLDFAGLMKIVKIRDLGPQQVAESQDDIVRRNIVCMHEEG